MTSHKPMTATSVRFYAEGYHHFTQVEVEGDSNCLLAASRVYVVPRFHNIKAAQKLNKRMFVTGGGRLLPVYLYYAMTELV